MALSCARRSIGCAMRGGSVPYFRSSVRNVGRFGSGRVERAAQVEGTSTPTSRLAYYNLLRNIHSTTAVKAPSWLSWRRPQRRLASSGRAHAAYARSRRSNASSLAGNPTPVYRFTLQIGDARSAPRLALQYPHPCYFTVLGPRDPEGASTEWVQITAPAFPCRPHLPSPCSQATPPASGQTRWRCLGPAK